MILLLIFVFNFINADFDPDQILKSYINAIENEDVREVLTDDFAVYDCKGKQISGSDFNMEKLKKLTDAIPFRQFEIVSSDEQNNTFDVEIYYFVSTFEVVYIENKGWKLKSEKHKTCLPQLRSYHSSLLINYEKIFQHKSESLLEEYMKNIEIGQFPKHQNFTIIGKSKNYINSTIIKPLVKLIRGIPRISNNRFYIIRSYESFLQFFVSIDETYIVTFDVVYNENGEYEIRSEKQRQYSNDDSNIGWFTSAFIDYRKTYRRIVEELVEKFKNAIKTKKTEDEIFAIKNINSSEIGYFTLFFPVIYYYDTPKSEVKQQFSTRNNYEKLMRYTFEFEDNKFNLIIKKKWTMPNYLERFYENEAKKVFYEYKKNILLADKIELKNIFKKSFKLCECLKGCMDLKHFEKQLEKPGNIVDFDNRDIIEFFSVNKTNGDIIFLKNRKTKFIAKYNFDLKRYQLAMEIRCEDDYSNFSNSEEWYNPEYENKYTWKNFEPNEPFMIFGLGWMFDEKPSIVPYKNFNVTSDAINVREFLKSNKEYELIQIICHRSQSQRNLIAIEFHSLYHVDITTEINIYLNNDFKTLILQLFYSPAVFDARMIMHGLRPSGYPTRWVYTVLLMTRTNREIEEIRQAFNDIQKNENGVSVDMFDYMASLSFIDKLEYTELAKDRGVLAELVRVRRDESLLTNNTKALEDAKRLHEALESFQEDKDYKHYEMKDKERDILEILTKTNLLQLKLIFRKFEELYRRSFRWTVHRKYVNEVKIQQMYDIIIRITQNRLKFFAGALRVCTSGAGTQNQDLIELIVRMSERNLESVRGEFDRQYPDENLIENISDDTYGSFRNALLALVRGNKNQ